MADEVSIPLDDNVPLPPKIYPGGTIWSPYRLLAQQMKTGQSFMVYGKKERVRAYSACKREQYASKGKKEFVVRLEGEGFYRIWRSQ